MTLHIMAMMYSGKPDPQWTIDGAEEAEFRRLIASSAFDGARPPTSWRLGFRGFTVIDPAVPDQALLRMGMGRSLPSFSFIGAPEVTRFLLSTAPERLLPSLPDTPLPEPPAAAPQPRLPRHTLPHTCPPPWAADAPAWDPNNPRFTGVFQARNNCYSYATNFQNTIAMVSTPQPGWKVGDNVIGSWEYDIAGIFQACISDGCQPVHSLETLAAGEGHHAVLVCNPRYDYHWYRQDNNGCWSHKVGTSPITNLDNAGHEITDPRFADRGQYSVLVSWMIIPPGIQLAPG